ncbi:MAG: succinate dehydrogenase, cytochrome b556 subunit [Cellulomonas sp.]|jgi:succinate dehydrogenase / fumarate reductase cytochrome b subunit|nr:succinate dehydrogenase, cytochrome b556 subunit [Cellulomonas sp.]
MWSWVLHRVTGFLIFMFLLVHILDTAMVRVSPETYDTVMGTYHNVIMGLGEAGLVAAILVHAFNGLRIVVVDFWSKGTKYQKALLWIAVAAVVLLMVPFLVIHLSNIFGGE